MKMVELLLIGKSVSNFTLINTIYLSSFRRQIYLALSKTYINHKLLRSTISVGNPTVQVSL